MFSAARRLSALSRGAVGAAPRPPRASAWAHAASTARRLCADAQPRAAVPALYQLPPLSNRKERMQKDGLVGLGAEFVRLEQSSKTERDKFFRVQSYNVALNKPAEFALTSVYGFGRNRSKLLAAKVGIFGHFRLSCMRESQREYIRRELNAACIAYDAPEPGMNAGAALQKEVLLNLQRLKDIRSYRGDRHSRRLPSRGVCARAFARGVWPISAMPCLTLTSQCPRAVNTGQRTKGNGRTRRRMGKYN